MERGPPSLLEMRLALLQRMLGLRTTPMEKESQARLLRARTKMTHYSFQGWNQLIYSMPKIAQPHMITSNFLKAEI
jgi:hypothetical protein